MSGMGVMGPHLVKLIKGRKDILRSHHANGCRIKIRGKGFHEFMCIKEDMVLVFYSNKLALVVIKVGGRCLQSS